MYCIAFLWLLLIFFFILGLQLFKMSLGEVFFEFIVLGVSEYTEIAESIHLCLFTKFGMFSAMISSSFFLHQASLFFSFYGNLMTRIFDILILSHKSMKLYFFFSIFFSLLFRLDNFYRFIFKFIDSFFCHLCFAVETMG